MQKGELRHPFRVLLQGRAGSGKTTLARRLVELLEAAGIRVSGFLTREIRENGHRVGFVVENVSGGSAVMAHVELRGPPRVGKYGVDLGAFERVALPALAPSEPGEVVVIDELGRMELASQPFRSRAAEVFERGVPVVATVHTHRHPFTDALKRRNDIEILPVTARTRDELPRVLAERIRS